MMSIVPKLQSGNVNCYNDSNDSLLEFPPPTYSMFLNVCALTIHRLGLEADEDVSTQFPQCKMRICDQYVPSRAHVRLSVRGR